MNINIENFEIRRSNPKILGSAGFSEKTERYLVKAKGIIGIDIFQGDKVKIVDLEGGQPCEVISFDKKGNNNQSTIGQKINGDAKFVSEASRG